MVRMNVGVVVLLVLATGASGKFPKGFVFGASTAAFQIEGAWLDDGKAPSVWDNLAHLPNYTADGTAPEVAADSYHLYDQDIQLLKEAGLSHYRLSISWPRIVPGGKAHSKINEIAVQHYLKMFEAIKNSGITLYVTLYHWDLPAALQYQGSGLVDEHFSEHFLYFAETCFERFGHLVKFWFTFNEPWVIAVRNDYRKRDLPTKSYRIGHSLLLAHARTVELYRRKYKDAQGGVIGIVFNSDMHLPKNKSKTEDVEAASRARDFLLGWFAHPIFYGDYPKVMRERIEDERLPKFTPQEQKLLLNSTDFFALNHYKTYLCEDGKFERQEDYWSDRNVTNSVDPSWNKTDMDWPVYPPGVYELMKVINTTYLSRFNTPFYITENGMANREPTRKEAENDLPRVYYLSEFLKFIKQAIDEGVNMKGYFVWSLLDNFEWKYGFSKRFGLVRVEYTVPPQRFPKGSYHWYKQFVHDNTEAE